LLAETNEAPFMILLIKLHIDVFGKNTLPFDIFPEMNNISAQEYGGGNTG
jgi:hypothetical protein